MREQLQLALAAGGAVAASVAYVSHFVGGWAAAVSPAGRRRCSEIPQGWGRGRVVVVTGGNGAIGARTVQALAFAGAEVVLACRSPAKGEEARGSLGLPEEALARVEVMRLDLGSIQSIQSFAQAFCAKFERLDVLILNAGVAKSFLGNEGFKCTEDGLEEMVGVNFLGHFLLTGLLLPVLRQTEGARVLGLTSVAAGNSYGRGVDVGSWTERRRGYQDWKQYGQSKLAIRLFIRALQSREPSLLCLACHPGVVAETSLMHQNGMGLLEWLYSLLMFKVLAMRPDFSHLTSVYLATAPARELEPGECYQPLGRRLRWTTHWLQRVGALQAPIQVDLEHPGLWADAERLLNERAAASLGVRLLPAEK